MQEAQSVRMISRFGFINGLATTSTFIVPAIALGVMILVRLEMKYAALLLSIFTIMIRFTGDWLFWTQMFPKELDSEIDLHNAHLSIKDILSSQVDAIKSIVDMIIDLAADIWLVYVALHAAIPPALVFLVFLGCQAVSAPIQGIIVDRLDKQKYRMFSMIVTMLTVVSTINIYKGIAHSTYTELFGLHYAALSTQIVIILCVKTLLTGTVVNAKAIIAKRIQTEINS